jgi:hypothetical protein
MLSEKLMVMVDSMLVAEGSVLSSLTNEKLAKSRG